jgi:hypothetical protein
MNSTGESQDNRAETVGRPCYLSGYGRAGSSRREIQAGLFFVPVVQRERFRINYVVGGNPEVVHSRLRCINSFTNP